MDTVKSLIQVAPIHKTYMILVLSCSCLCLIHWSQVLSWEWRCSWSSADRRCSNYIWVIKNFIDHQGASYIRGLTVCLFCITGSSRGDMEASSGGRPARGKWADWRRNTLNWEETLEEENLKHLDWDKRVYILQKTFWNVFSRKTLSVCNFCL